MKRRSSSMAPSKPSLTSTAAATAISIKRFTFSRNNTKSFNYDVVEHSDKLNYLLLIALYTLQGVPMGLSASIPFLIQQKVRQLLTHDHHPTITKMAYRAQAIFALCSWPFSLKLLWAPLVDAVFCKRIGRRKSWLVPIQILAGGLMFMGSDYVEDQLGLSEEMTEESLSQFDVRGVTAFFFALYFLMATQDIAVDGWALTMLSKKNRGRGPVCNSIGQNLGYFLSFVGFLALNDAESSEMFRSWFGMKSQPGIGLVSLGGFIKFMGGFMLVITTLVGLLKREDDVLLNEDDEPQELDASEIGLRETYHRLWAVCTLPSVKWLFLILLTYRFPTALSDNVKFLKAVEFGLSKQTTALLSPAIVLPLGIAVPILASKIWHNHPLKQFLTAYKLRITAVAMLDVLMLLSVRYLRGGEHPDAVLLTRLMFWGSLIFSTAMQAAVQSLQFNAQMTFFASRVDPAIGGSYMTLLNTAANLGGTWPASVVMYLVGQLTVPPTCEIVKGEEICEGGRDAYFPLQFVFSILGCAWLYFLGGKVMQIANLPEESWRTGIAYKRLSSMTMMDMEDGGVRSRSNSPSGEKKRD